MEGIQKNVSIMSKHNTRKKELDRKRTEWRKKHRILNGKIILYPDKPPEHINARASKTYNWFWKKILLTINTQDIPAVISTIKIQINAETDPKKIQLYRTMIGMAEDAYQLRKLEEIKDYDTELQLGKKPVYNSEKGIIYRNGKFFSTDYNKDETEIIVRDIEGVIVDVLSSGNDGAELKKDTRVNAYKNWDYMKET